MLIRKLQTFDYIATTHQRDKDGGSHGNGPKHNREMQKRKKNPFSCNQSKAEETVSV